MPSTKELKARITNAKEIQKLTRAMHLISSTKLQRARTDLEHTRPYFEALRQETLRVLQAAGTEGNPWLVPAPEEDVPCAPWVCLLVTADRGMDGAYNKNVIREAERLLEQHPGGKLFVYGKKGMSHFRALGITPEEFSAPPGHNTFAGLSRGLAETFLEGYIRGDWKSVYVVFTDMRSSLVAEVRTRRILPFSAAELPGPEAVQGLEIFPSAQQVLENIMHNYATAFIYNVLVDSYCSEQNARMMAMDADTQNAQELLDQLSLQHNRLRQGIITQEITEISAGAKAQRAVHEREEASS